MTRDVLPVVAAIVAVAAGAGVLFVIGRGPAVPPAAVRPESGVTAAPASPATPAEAPPLPADAPPLTVDAPPSSVDMSMPRSLESRRLLVPVEGVRGDALTPGFDLARGARQHEALDIMAPTGTPVLAVDDGHIEKLFTSQAGGLTIYQFDPERQHAYYYAHLDRYAPGLAEGDRITRQQVIGYVGTTGNAPKDAPHLHFAIMRLGSEKRWWDGTAVDPYPLLRVGETATAREQRP